MPIPREHDVKVVPNPVTTPTPFPFKVVCSCQFEVLAETEEKAKQWAAVHKARHQPYGG